MSRFNHYINNHFGSCRVLAYARDMYRERDVKICALPGEFDVVGVTDGTDAWLAPVVRERQYFHKVDVWQLMNDLRNGVPLPKAVPPQAARRRVLEDDEPAPVQHTRRRVAVDEEQPKRRRLASV